MKEWYKPLLNKAEEIMKSAKRPISCNIEIEASIETIPSITYSIKEHIPIEGDKLMSGHYLFEIEEKEDETRNQNN